MTGRVVSQPTVILANDASVVASSGEEAKTVYLRKGAGCSTCGRRLQNASAETTSAAQSSAKWAGEGGSSQRKTENHSEKFEPIGNWVKGLKDVNKNKYM